MTIKQSVLTLAATVLLAAVIASGLRAQQDHPATNGRYALSPGHYVAIGKNGTTATFPAVFKIDTATGRTWLYENLQDEQGKFHNGWSLVAEFH